MSLLCYSVLLGRCLTLCVLMDSISTQINIDSKTRACVLSRIAEPNENTFKSAEEHVHKLMQTDPFPRFISTRLKENKDTIFSTILAVV